VLPLYECCLQEDESRRTKKADLSTERYPPAADDLLLVRIELDDRFGCCNCWSDRLGYYSLPPKLPFPLLPFDRKICNLVEPPAPSQRTTKRTFIGKGCPLNKLQRTKERGAFREQEKKERSEKSLSVVITAQVELKHASEIKCERPCPWRGD